MNLPQKLFRRFLVPGAVRVVHTREHNRIFPARERHKFVFQPRDTAPLQKTEPILAVFHAPLMIARHIIARRDGGQTWKKRSQFLQVRRFVRDVSRKGDEVGHGLAGLFHQRVVVLPKRSSVQVRDQRNAKAVKPGGKIFRRRVHFRYPQREISRPQKPCREQRRRKYPARAMRFFRGASHFCASFKNFFHFITAMRQRKALLRTPLCEFPTNFPALGFVHRIFIVICVGGCYNDM